MKLLSFAMTYMSRSMCAVAVAALIVMMFLTLADVILRAVSQPIPGTYELVGILGAIVIGFGLPYTSMLRGHVIMDFLTERLPASAQAVLHPITRILGIVFFLVAAWNLCLLANDYRIAHEVTLTLKLPLYPIPYGIAFCCFAECLILLGDMLGLPQGAEK